MDSIDPTPIKRPQESTDGPIYRPLGSLGSSSRTSLENEGDPIEFDQFRHWSGNDSTFPSFHTQVAHSEEEWREMWRLVAGMEQPGHLPQGTMAVGIFLGQRQSRGYSVRIAMIRRTSSELDTIYIHYIENKPRPPSRPIPTYAHPTRPWVIYLLPASDSTVRFKRLRTD